MLLRSVTDKYICGPWLCAGASQPTCFDGGARQAGPGQELSFEE